MSRFALEWAKAQQPGSAEQKTALLILGDCAEGADNTCILFEQRLADMTSIDRSVLPTVIQDLESNGYLWTAVLPLEYHPSADFQEVRLKAGNRIKFDLLLANDGHESAGPHPSISGDNDKPHAVYRLYDPKGVLLYVGESQSPEHRFTEHQLEQPWWFEVATREITWHPNEGIAKAEERWAIRHAHPVYNIKDSPTPPDSNDKPLKRRYVKETARWSAYAEVLGHVRADLRGGRFDIGPLPAITSLARRYGVGWRLIDQVLNELVRTREVAYLKDPCRPLGHIYVRDWGEW